MTEQSGNQISFKMMRFLDKCYGYKRKKDLAYQLRLEQSITWICKNYRDYMKSRSPLSKGLKELNVLRSKDDNV